MPPVRIKPGVFALPPLWLILLGAVMPGGAFLVLIYAIDRLSGRS